ncbi:MAG TPA: glycerate kinase [Candidatus Dormibacteraeota bacterium]|nr:glycerate kinase [Candidatus Dormibacteraeota bacterium]
MPSHAQSLKSSLCKDRVRLKLLIAPDKFKGTLTADAAAQAIARGWRTARPQDQLDLVPLSDGGDGFGEVAARLLQARPRRVKTIDAAHRPHFATWWFEPRTKTAIIESANIVGLAMLPPGKFHPFELDTFGLGKVLQTIARAGARRCWLGIGGSATNDGGFGLARVLGWRFFSKEGDALEHWTDLEKLDRIEPPLACIFAGELLVAVDVQNKLLGPHGATRVYGPQKGLKPSDFPKAERCLRRLAAVARKRLNSNAASAAGAGAAGGLGFGLVAFAGAKLCPGFQLLADQTDFVRKLRQADLVITGEGKIDRSTFMGKATGEVARLCRQHRIPCIAFAGCAETTSNPKPSPFRQLHALTDLTTPTEAKTNAAHWLRQSVLGIAKSSR